MLLCLHTAMAQQFKTSQGITTVTVVKPKSEPKAPKPKRSRNTQKKAVKSGFQHIATVGYNYDIQVFASSINAEYIFGYRFNNYLFAGIGTGLNAYLGTQCADNFISLSAIYGIYRQKNGTYNSFWVLDDDPLILRRLSVPLYAHLRTYFTKTKIQPFFALSVGAMLSAKNTIFSGREYEDNIYYVDNSNKIAEYSTSRVHIEPMIGADWRLSKKFALNLQAGVTIRTAPYIDVSYGYGEINHKFRSCGISVKVGLTF